MTTQPASTLFAFKLAEKEEKEAKPANLWQVRDGVSVAGCTDPSGGEFDVRYSTNSGGDNGVWC